MKSKNSFKKLMEEEEKQYPHAPVEIEKEVIESVRVIKLMGNVVELYLTRIIELFLSMMGGNKVQADTIESREDSENDSEDSLDEKAAD